MNHVAASVAPAKTSDPLLVEVATRFYLRDHSKVQIAQDLGLSRFKVARLLAEARERKIVSIKINVPLLSDPDRLEHLRLHLGLQELFIVPANPDLANERDALGREAARYLSASTHAGHRIGFSWGRTLLPIARHLKSLPAGEFVQLTGVVGNDPSQSPIAFLSDLSIRSGSTGKALIAPLICSSAQFAATQRAEPGVAEVLGLYDHLDMAFLSVGSWQPRVTQLEQHLSIEESKTLDSLGAVADFSGHFFDADGNHVQAPVNERLISISVEQLRHTPVVVAVAGQIDKVNAIHSVCASGLPTCLITTDEVAEALLTMSAVTNPPFARAAS